MSDIEWTDETWNPVTGCTKVSPGCAHCYAETFAERFRGVPGHPFEQGFDLKLWPERLTKPFSWKKPRKVFVNSMSDLFHEGVPFEFIDRVFAVMALTPQHTYQVLTKRPERMREYLTWTDSSGSDRAEAIGYAALTIYEEHGAGDFSVANQMILGGNCSLTEPLPFWPLPNVWLGTSVENQHWADIRIPELLATPAAVRFLSCEPLLGPLDLRLTSETHRCECGEIRMHCGCPGIAWVIVGGESGPKARAFDLAWARSIVAQCRAAGVPCFVKQLGAKPVDRHATCAENHPPEECWPDTRFEQGQWAKLKSRKGGEPDEWPEDLRVREWPLEAVSRSPLAVGGDS